MHFKNFFFYIVVILIIITPRLYGLGADFHSIDSDRWFRRSVAFQEAFLNKDFAGTYQKQHPGVTLMWLGGIGYKVAQVSHLKIFGSGLDENIPSDFRIINFALKFPLVLADMFLITISFFIIKKLFKFKIALLYVTLLLTDSFFFFYTRQFHLDVLMSLFCINSVLLLVLFLKSNKTIYFALSSIFCALAFLTKTPSIAFLMGNLFSIFFYSLFSNNNRYKKQINRHSGLDPESGYKNRILKQVQDDSKMIARKIINCVLNKYLLLYLMVFLVTYILVFPANWVAPFETTRQILVDSLTNTKELNIHHLFNTAFSFLGFKYYIFVFLFRFSPFILILAVVALIQKLVLLFRQCSRSILNLRASVIPGLTRNLPLKKFQGDNLVVLPFIGFIFLVGLLYIDNKVYERYLVPFVPFLALIGAIFVSKYLSLKKSVIISLTLLTLFGIYTLNKHPNYASYASLIPEKYQIKLFSEIPACDSILYEIAQYLNKKEIGNEDYDVSMSGAYRLCLKPFMGARVNDFNNLKRPKYLILYWTDFEWLQDARIQREYSLIKTYKLNGMGIYYVYEKK